MDSPVAPFFSEADLLAVYDQHPLQAAPLLQRVRSITGRAVNQLDLAIDEETGITDQNHIGGVPFVDELAGLAGLRASALPTKDKVIDLGAGLGGSARLLAYQYGCSVLAIDISPTRCAASRELTRFVNLQHLVRTERADITAMAVPRGSADLLWAQNALAHICDLPGLFRRWNGALVEGGQIAIEDFCLMRPPALPGEKTLLATLARAWLSYFSGMDAWRGALEAGGFQILRTVDVSAAVPAWLDHLREAAAKRPEPPPEREVEGWEAGRELAEAGVIGYFRVLAKKTPAKKAP